MKELTKENYFKELSKEGLELSQKGKFNYSSWSDVWDFLKKNVSDAEYEWCENKDGGLGFVDDYGCFTKVKVWSDSLSVKVTQHLHVMDFNNNAVQKDKLTAKEINKTYQRCLVKAIATGFGLGLYIYKGEDLPDESDGKTINDIPKKVTESINEDLGVCQKCGAKNLMSQGGKKYCSAKCWL